MSAWERLTESYKQKQIARYPNRAFNFLAILGILLQAILDNLDGCDLGSGKRSGSRKRRRVERVTRRGGWFAKAWSTRIVRDAMPDSSQEEQEAAAEDFVAVAKESAPGEIEESLKEIYALDD